MKKRLIIWLGILFIFIFLFDLSAKPNENYEDDIFGLNKSYLEKRLKNVKGKNRVWVLIKLSFLNGGSDPEYALTFAQEALSLATEIGDRIGSIKALVKLSQHNVRLKRIKEARVYVDKALEEATTLRDRRINSEVRFQKGVVCRMERKYDEAEKFFLKAIELVERDDKLRHLIFEPLTQLGHLYNISKQYDKALEYYKKALKLSRLRKNRHREAFILDSIALVNISITNYQEALNTQLKALQILEEIGEKKHTAHPLLSIGTIYGNLEDYQKALDYYHEALKIYDEEGDEANKAITIGYIGKAYLEMGKFSSALTYCKNALAVHIENNDQRSICIEYIRIGDIHLHRDEPAKAMEYYRRAFRISEEIGDITQIARSQKKIGSILIRYKKYKNAFNSLSIAANIFKKIKENNQLQDTYRMISGLLEETGDYKKALEYHKRCSKIKDTIYNQQSSRQIAETQTRYDTLKKEQKIELLEKDAEIKRLELSRQRTARNFFIAAFILALLILILIFKRYLYLFAFWKKEKYVGQYRLQEEIGAGGMGTVYKAHNIKDKKHTVAVKVLKPELFKDRVQRARFKQEAVIIDKLDHPNIIKIYERGEYREKMYIAMELLKGKTLDEKLAEKNERQEYLQLDVALSIMCQTAEALTAIHEKNIIHRDLKPSNIMIQDGDRQTGRKLEVKLLDFGLARQKYQTRITRTGMIMGTINYMSPEQLIHSEYTSASDVYSLGVTNYEILTGKIAFPGEFPNDVMKQILDSNPVEPKQYRPEIPDQLNRLILEMMSREKEQRPTIMEVKITLNKLKGID